jgi:hypothetical protein
MPEGEEEEEEEVKEEEEELTIWGRTFWILY